MGTADFYPLYNGYDNADEIEVSTETLEKYLAGEITMDDVDFSKHKLLKNEDVYKRQVYPCGSGAYVILGQS